MGKSEHCDLLVGAAAVGAPRAVLTSPRHLPQELLQLCRTPKQFMKRHKNAARMHDIGLTRQTEPLSFEQGVEANSAIGRRFPSNSNASFTRKSHLCELRIEVVDADHSRLLGGPAPLSRSGSS
jgi:hypothetical protein